MTNKQLTMFRRIVVPIKALQLVASPHDEALKQDSFFGKTAVISSNLAETVLLWKQV